MRVFSMLKDFVYAAGSLGLDFLHDVRYGYNGARKVVYAFIFLVALLSLMVYLLHKEAREWEEFVEANNCQIVAKTRGRTSKGIGTSFDANGNYVPTVITTREPDRITWKCDDGLEYTR